MGKKIRIKDIAKMAEVSVGTVDRVIHNRGEVAQESYDKVMKILQQSGYKPNLIARTLGSKKPIHIAAVIPDPNQDEYWKLAYDGVMQAEAEWAQYDVQIELFLFDLYDKNSFASQADLAFNTAPGGILIAPIFYQEADRLLTSCRNASIPFVLFNNTLENSHPLSFIGQDLYQSGRVGAELLHIHQQSPATFAILHVYDDIHNSTHLSEKEKGFRDFFSELHDPQIKVFSADLSNNHHPSLTQELNTLLATPHLKGILVTTSKGASIVCSMLEKSGNKNVKLVAYDLLQENIHYLQKGTIDFLINQNSKSQASLGIRKLANWLLFKKEVTPTYLFPLEIISRQSLPSYLSIEII